LHGASYQITELIAKGAMGAVYRAVYRDEAQFEREVAVKLLRPDVDELDELGRRLRDEARLLGLLRHPAIVRVDRLVLLDGRWALVMELVDGLDLRVLASSLQVPTGVALEVVEVVADALDVAGRGRDLHDRPLELQHRDIKPSNVMVTVHGEVKVLDFGVAQARFSGRESATQAMQPGTVDYMAPERLAGGRGGPAADIFSLGVVLWEVLSAERLGRSSPQLVEHQAWLERALQRLALRRPHEPPQLAELIGAMLAWSPQERPTAAQLVERAGMLAGLTGDPPLRVWCRRELRQRPPSSTFADSLVGSVLRPGSTGGLAVDWGSADEPTWDDRTAVGSPPVPVTTGPSPRDGALVPPTDEAGMPVRELPASVPPPARPASKAPLLVAMASLVLLLFGGLVAYLSVATAPPEPEPAAAAAVIEPPSVPAGPSPTRADSPAPIPQPRPVPARATVPTPNPEPISVVQPAPEGVWDAEGPSDDGDDGSIWDGTRPGGSLSTAGLEPAQTSPEQIWGAQAEPAPAAVAWTDGVRVELTGDAHEVVLVDEERGFPVPGVVPEGSWFVRVRFDAGEPVVAGVVEIAGPGPRTLSCDRKLSWCSVRED